MHRDITVHVQDIKKLNDEMSSGKLFIEFDAEDIFMKGFDAEPVEDYSPPANFPLCCAFHTQVMEGVFSWFNTFPNCCKFHKRISEKSWFKIDNYASVPGKILKNISYTAHHVIRRIDQDDWYEDITNYIEYILASFGSPAVGASQYANYLSYYFEKGFSNYYIPLYKRNRLLKYLKGQSQSKDQKVDLNVLYNTFQKWLHVFPDLVFFYNLKSTMVDKMPMDLVLHKHEYNPYLDETKSKLRTNREFIDLLTKYTRKLLLEINTSQMIANNVIKDRDVYKVNLINERHRIKQNKLLVLYDKGEMEYFKVMKKWLKNEEDYFKEVYPMFNSMIKISQNVASDNIENNSVSGESDEKIIKVFISYCWEDNINQDHKTWVRNLADRLIDNGIEVILDQYDIRLGNNMNFFMENSIKNADKILVIFSPDYKARAENRRGGAGYEYSILNSELYNNQINNERIIPVIRLGDVETSIPAFMQSYVRQYMTDDDKFEQDFDKLLRNLYNEPEFKKPPLGRRPKFD